MTTLTGTLRLLRLGLRRDRLVLPVWLIALGGLIGVAVSSVAGLYPTAAERDAAATFAAANRLARAIDGPASGSSLGALTMAETFGVLAILVALMSIQTVARHTRQDEETGRAELLGSTVVGRHARLTAALLLALLANAALAATTTIVLLAQALPVDGSLAAGFALGAVGVVFAAVAAVTAQLSESQRGANGLAALALGVAFLLRAIGDAVGEIAPSGDKVVSAWPSWLSPIGWGQQVRPFSDNTWDVFVLFALLTVALVSIAFLLIGRRDVDAGLLATRPGPPAAGPQLSRPLGFAWRLQRGTVLGWTAALMVLGAVFGALAEGADEFVGLSDELAGMLEPMAADGSLLDAYVAFVMGFLGVAAAGFTVQSLLRARAEEAGGRLESVLATAVSRGRWLAANVGLTAVATAGMLLLTGLTAGVTYGVAAGEYGAGTASFVPAAAVQIPAALALGGLVVAAFGLVSGGATVGVGWAALGASLVIGRLGEALGLPEAAQNVSPFTHVPAVPAEGFTAAPLVALLAVAALLACIGAVGFRRRDIAAS